MKLTLLQELGRVLNAANETRLRQALALIASALQDVEKASTLEDAKAAVAKVAQESIDVAQAPLEESIEIEGEVVPLLEGAVRKDGTIRVKVISPGWGTSGFYSEEVLKRDGPKAFPIGTKMYWDHPTKTEEAERPERSLKDLAAEFVSVPTFESGPKGPGLYADAKVFQPYQAAVNELAPHIGASIRALGKATAGEAEGRKGRIIDQLVAGESVDFVTIAGRGGEILSLFEAARGSHITEEHQVDEKEAQALREAQATSEAARKVAEEAQKTAEASRDTALAEGARAKEALLLREAKDVVVGVLAKAEIPDITRARLTEVLAANPPIKDGAIDQTELVKKITEAVKAEVEYLTKLTGNGTIRGLGGTSDGIEAKEADARLTSAFGRLGLDEKAAKVAAEGRSH